MFSKGLYREIKKERRMGVYTEQILYCFAFSTYDWQPERKHVSDGSQNDGKAKRWSHLRIVRVVVPSGKSAGEGENNQEKEEM